MRPNITDLESVSIIIVLPYHTGTDQATYRYSVQVTLERKRTWRMAHPYRSGCHGGLHILSGTQYSVSGKPFSRNRRGKEKEGEYDDFGFGVRNCPSPIHRPVRRTNELDSSEAPRLVADWILLCHIRNACSRPTVPETHFSVAQKGTSGTHFMQ